MPFLPPNQQRQSTEGSIGIFKAHKINIPKIIIPGTENSIFI